MFKIESEESNFGEKLIDHIVESRMRQKKNTFIAICGKVGQGKSYTALKIAEIIQPNFKPKEQVVYYPNQFLEVIEKAKTKDYKVIILDEAHVTINARLWYSFTNLAISLVASTFRQLKNLVVIVVTPSINWIEKSIREMIDYYGVVTRKEDTPVYLKLYEVEFNYFDMRDQLPYLKRIVFRWNGRMYKLNTIRIGLPSQEIIKEYEEISTEFKRKLIAEKMEEVVSKIAKASKRESKDIEEIAATLLENQKLLGDLSKKTKKGFKLKKEIIKRMFKLTDKEAENLESKLVEKMKELGWI